MESLQTLQFLPDRLLSVAVVLVVIYCVGLPVFQYNSDDCIRLLVATVCSNESTLSLQPRAKRLQMIVGNLGRTSQAHWWSGSEYPKHPDTASHHAVCQCCR